MWVRKQQHPKEKESRARSQRSKGKTEKKMMPSIHFLQLLLRRATMRLSVQSIGGNSKKSSAGRFRTHSTWTETYIGHTTYCMNMIHVPISLHSLHSHSLTLTGRFMLFASCLSHSLSLSSFPLLFDRSPPPPSPLRENSQLDTHHISEW